MPSLSSSTRPLRIVFLALILLFSSNTAFYRIVRLRLRCSSTSPRLLRHCLESSSHSPSSGSSPAMLLLLLDFSATVLNLQVISHRTARRLRCSSFSSNFFRYCLESSRRSPVPFPIAQASPPAADFEKSLTSLSAGWTGA